MSWGCNGCLAAGWLYRARLCDRCGCTAGGGSPCMPAALPPAHRAGSPSCSNLVVRTHLWLYAPIFGCTHPSAGEEMVLTFDMQLEECLQPKYRGLQVRAGWCAAGLGAATEPPCCPAAAQVPLPWDWLRMGRWSSAVFRQPSHLSIKCPLSVCIHMAGPPSLPATGREAMVPQRHHWRACIPRGCAAQGEGSFNRS